MENLKRARSWKRRLRPRANLKNDVPVLYSTAAARRVSTRRVCTLYLWKNDRELLQLFTVA